MTVHKFIGRCATIINTLVRPVIGAACLSAAVQLHATPAADYTSELLDALAVADGAWADSLLHEPSAATPYDEQIFTELSPILDSPQGVKLPDDQQLTD